ncbi:MAG: flippase [Ignavibacteriaceae bacterium]|nr:flippase [Ignavibacteriaceae bacterium]
MLVSFAVSLYVIRYLGPADFGLLSYAISFSSLFAFIATLGIENIAVREILKFPEKVGTYLGTAFFLRLIGAAIVLIVVVLALLINGESAYNSSLILIITAGTVFQSIYVLDYYFQARLQIKYTTIILFVSVIASSIVKLILIYLQAGLIYFAGVQTLEIIIAAAGYTSLIPKVKKVTGSWKFSSEIATSLLKISWPIILASIMVSFYSRIDQVLIQNMLDSYQTGIFAAAVKISELPFFVPVAVCTALFPAIVNAKLTSETIYLSRIQKLYDLMALIALSFAIPVTIFSEQIIWLLYSDKYQGAGIVMAIYVWAAVFSFLGVASSQYLLAENLLKISFYRTAIGLVLNIVLNIFLIQAYGISGAAIATLISYSAPIFALYLFKSTREQANMMIRALFLINVTKEAIKRILK